MTENKKSRLAYLLGWLIGIFFLIVGLMGLSDSIPGGVLIIIGALVMLPPIGGIVESKAGLGLWPRLVLVLLLVLAGAVLAASAPSSKGDGTPPTSAENADIDDAGITEMNRLIKEADSLVEEAFQDNLDKDFDSARKKSLEAKSKLKELQILLSQQGISLTNEEKRDLETFIEYEQRWSTLIYKTANIDEAAHSVMQNLGEGDEIRGLLPSLELLQRGYRENADDWRGLADYVFSLREFRKKQGITDENVQIIYGLADTTESLADELGTIIGDFKTQTPDYVPVAEREIQPAPQPSLEPTPIITDELARFFDSFDTNRDNKLSIGEAQEFYYWVENNIVYRYDYEEELNPVVGTLVGDGRAGGDYRQTTLETMQELAGDCEDMATLEQAFYRYYGIDAYVVGVNAEEPDVLDHASTIVWIADEVDLFRETLGDLVYYDIGPGASDIYGDPIRPGVYMLVDNAYSGVLGYLSGGLEPGTFRIHCAIPLDKGYDDWSDVVNNCGVPMD